MIKYDLLYDNAHLNATSIRMWLAGEARCVSINDITRKAEKDHSCFSVLHLAFKEEQ